jgi:hypothetical protein
MTNVFRSSKLATVSAERTCSMCGKRWQASQLVVGGSGPLGHFSPQGAQQYARIHFDLKAEEFLKNKDMRCPDCGGLSREAMEIHFPTGFPDGLLAKYREATRESLWMALMLGWPSVLILVLMLVWRFNVLGVVAAVAFALPPLYFLVELVRARSGDPLVRERLRSATEEELRALAIECYEKNGKSLCGVSRLEDRQGRSPWITLLLSFARRQAPL